MIFVGQSSCFYTQIFFTLALQYSRGGKFFREQFGGKNFRENILQNFVKITVKHMCLNLFSVNTTSESIFFLKCFLSMVFSKKITLKCINSIPFPIWILFHEHSRFTGQQGIGEAIALSPLYRFYPLHWHLGISRAISAKS